MAYFMWDLWESGKANDSGNIAAYHRLWRLSEFTVRWSLSARYRWVSANLRRQGRPTWSRSSVEPSARGVDGAAAWHVLISRTSRSAERRHSSQTGATRRNADVRTARQSDVVCATWDLTEMVTTRWLNDSLKVSRHLLRPSRPACSLTNTSIFAKSPAMMIISGYDCLHASIPRHSNVAGLPRRQS